MHDTRNPDGRESVPGPVAGSHEIYEGVPGQTSLETVHISVPGRGVQNVQVYRCVNVATHPGLREAAQNGQLHRWETGEELAIPFVYHDPAGEHFVLVIPAALRHRELHEKASLMLKMAEDTASVIPAYAMELKTVLGVEGLNAYLSEGNSAARVNSQLAAQREEIERRAEELARLQGQLEQQHAELARREQDLDARLQMLSTQEVAPSPKDDELEGTPTVAPQAVSESLSAPAGSAVDDSDAVEFSSEDEDEAYVEIDDADVESLADDALDDDDGEESDAAELNLVSEELDLLDEIPDVVPPEDFGASDPAELRASLSEGRLWLFAHEPANEYFGEDVEQDLLIQLSVVDDIPVVMLTLVLTPQAQRPWVARLVLVPQRTEDRGILHYLSQSFAATVLFFADGGVYERQIELQATRQGNVQWILDEISDATPRSDDEVHEAIERAMAAPPPVTMKGHPFGEEWEEPRSSQAAWEAAERLGSWADVEKRKLLIAALSIPLEEVQERFRLCGEVTARYGLSASSPMMMQSLSDAEAPEAVNDLLSTFARQDRGDDRWDLQADAAVENWRRLLELAWEHELPIEEDVAAMAAVELRSLDGEARAFGEALGEPGQVSWTPDNLGAGVRDPRHRLDALRHCCLQTDAETLKLLAEGLCRVTEEQLRELLPSLLAMGDHTADLMIDLLAAKQGFVRHFAMLALAKSGSRRAGSPLVKALVNEPTDRWEEFGRIVGSTGTLGVRALTKSAKDASLDGRRLGYALAHMALGSEEDLIEQWRQDDKPSIVAVAEEAKRLLARAQQHRNALDGEDEIDIMGISLARYAESITGE